MLPPTIPIFPLPNVVLFPNVFLPLHIFEPRYRAMVADALKGDRIIGMALLRPGFEADYDGRPAVYETGCAGLITHSEPLADGRFDIVLRGMEKFRILEEDTSRPYRLARVEPLPEMTGDDERAEVRARRQRLEAVLAATIERSSGEPRFPPAVPDDDLVNALAQYLPLEPVERQALLERHGIAERCRGLIELLEMHTMTGRNLSWKDRSVH
jgi:Lon protease-like protein